MKKFSFRLKGLENLRSAELDALRQSMLATQEELRRAEQNLATLRSSIADSRVELMRLRTEQADPLIVQSIEGYISLLQRQEQSLQQQLQQLQRRFEELRDQLGEKHKEKKVLEKYRERLSDEHSLLVGTQIQNELDETAAKLHLRAG